MADLDASAVASESERRPRPRSASVRFGLAVAAALGTFAIVDHWVLRPLHEQGVLQPVLAFLQGIDHLVQIPGWTLAQLLGLRAAGHHPSMAGWAFGLAVNVALYFYLAARGYAFWQWIAGRQASPGESPLAPGRACTRRRLLTGSLKVACLSAAAGLGYGMLIEPRRWKITHQPMRIHDLPPSLDRLRIVQLSDIHHGPWLSLAYVAAVVDAANGLEPDLICLTGDYVHRSPEYIEPVVAELARLRPKIAAVAVLGNHDWWEDAARSCQAFAGTEIVLIDNGRRVLTPDRKLVAAADAGLAFCGVGDLWEDAQDYVRALAGLPASMPRLLLSHNPDVAEESIFVGSGLRVDLMLSGHTHGGQVVIPGYGPAVIPSRFGNKYAEGLVRGPVCPVFVSRGIGVSGMPLRLGAPPEIVVLEIQAAGECGKSGMHSCSFSVHNRNKYTMARNTTGCSRPIKARW